MTNEQQQRNVDDDDDDVPLFRDCEVLWEHRQALGHGTFNSVWELKRIALRAWHVVEDGPQAHPAMKDDVSRQRLADQVNAVAGARNDGGNSSKIINERDETTTAPSSQPRWAIKHMRDDLDEKEERLVRQDMRTEMHILKTLPKHPNIITLYGIGLADYDDEEEDEDDDTIQPIFLILGLVPTMLTQKMDEWAEQQQQLQQRQESNWTNLILGTLFRWGDPKEQARQLWKERFRILPPLASALAHIHRHGIVYRDVKADNVGIDVGGSVKLFDFGLAKELPRKGHQRGTPTATETYQLTGNTGTLIYMAPEVQRKQPYGTAVDVYSLSILIHQVLSLEPCPFDIDDEVSIRHAVLDEGYRPTLPDMWPEALRDLLTRMWAEESSERPLARDIATRLTGILQTEEDQ